MSSEKKIVVIGAGPTGLGAALRLSELGHQNWTIVDPAPIGGLSRSYVDDQGFYWDLGGHVIFSHYAYFDDIMDFALGDDWLYHQRESWVWVAGVWVPYPFQNNIHRLPEEERIKALDGLLDVYRAEFEGKPANFEEHFNRQFGSGICDIFMKPYNFKVWAVPPKNMSTEWVGERVATVDVKRVCRNVITGKDDPSWGPNNTFRFPLKGGTGAIWSAVGDKLPQQHVKAGNEGFSVESIDADRKVLKLRNGDEMSYDELISTMPIDHLLKKVEGKNIDKQLFHEVADGMVYSSTHVIGIGLKGVPPPHLKTMCWMYFPEDAAPFYRATVFSNYSPNNAPAGCWSLMLEVSESKEFKPVNQETLFEDCIKGCIASNLITEQDEIVSKWKIRLDHGYPTPFVGRNDLLDKVQPTLRDVYQIRSRGRFGGWKYEVANQDHSLMQGVEAVDEILGGPAELTYHQPGVVNAFGGKNVEKRFRGWAGREHTPQEKHGKK